MIRRRPTQIFSLAFLDCICCGFGAVILVFILTISQKQTVDKADVDAMSDRVRQLASQITVSEQDLDRLAKVLAAAQLELQDVNAKNNLDQLKLSARQRELLLMLQQTGAMKDALNTLLGEKKNLPTEDHAPIPIPNVDRRQYLTGVRLHGEGIQIPHPARIDAARDVAGERRVDVSVRQDGGPRLQVRDDPVGEPVGEVGRVQQAERRRRQEVLLLAALGRLPDEVRRVPLGKYNLMPARFEPLVQELDLRALAGAVDPFDDEQFSRILVRIRQVVEHMCAR